MYNMIFYEFYQIFGQIVFVIVLVISGTTFPYFDIRKTFTQGR